MAESILIHNVLLADRPSTPRGWVLVGGDTISAVGEGDVPAGTGAAEVVDGRGAFLMPGLIDTHVHFREPGLTHKATIGGESEAALAGGVASYIDMPNTVPPTTTALAFYDKLMIASETSQANYGFMLGAAAGVMEELPKIEPELLPAVKLFMGATTGGMAMPPRDELHAMMKYCAERRIPVVVHAEDNDIIAANVADAVKRYGSADAVPLAEHSTLRSREACIACARRAVELARRFGTRLHIAHLSTADELSLFAPGAVGSKQITAETTPLYVDGYMSRAENRTWRHKVNPAVKTYDDALALRRALEEDLIDTIGTDHAPHLTADKEGGALKAASGAPWIQFALIALLDIFSPYLVARKMSAAPAELFGIEKRGRIEAGYYADLVLVEPSEPYTVSDSDVISACGWTPYAGRTFRHRVVRTWVNGGNGAMAMRYSRYFLTNTVSTAMLTR